MYFMFSRYVRTPSPVRDVLLILDLLLLNKILLQTTGLYHTSNLTIISYDIGRIARIKIQKMNLALEE